jgi:hypothetical protein
MKEKITYLHIIMADDLLPNNNLSNFDKHRIFVIINKLIEIQKKIPMEKKETY